VLDSMSAQQATLAVESRAFPLFIYDPRKGEKLRERPSLVGHPAQKEDWWTPPKSEKTLTFIDFARTEGRFAKQFDKDGNPTLTILQTQEERLRNWRLLQELAGVR
jgi:pyruvate/2-oxoacid:ferredoxin oxidoreductase beta subunit